MASREYELHLQKEDVKQEIRRELKIKEGILSVLGRPLFLQNIVQFSMFEFK